MNYEPFEDAIIDLLKAIPGVIVTPLPHVAALNDPRPTSKPQLFVIVNGSNFTPPDEVGIVSQLTAVQCEIFMRAKVRRGIKGINWLYEQVEKCLLGYRLPNAITPIVFSDFGYVAGIQNNWQYALTFTFNTYIVQPDRREPVGTIKKITVNADVK